MERANTIPAPTPVEDVYVDEGCAGLRLTEGGTLTILRFDDGEHRLMLERGGVSMGWRLSEQDVRNLRAVTGLVVTL